MVVYTSYPITGTERKVSIMIKKTAFLLAVLMLLASFTGCRKQKEEVTVPTNTEPATTEPVTEEATTEPTETTEVEVIDYSITDKDSLEKVLGRLVDLSLYDFWSADDTDQQKNTCKYVLKDKNDTPDLDFTVTLAGSTQFTLPFMLPDVQQQGWTLDAESTGKQISPSKKEICGLENEAGKTFTAFAYNLGETAQVTEKLPCYEISLFRYTYDEETRTMLESTGADFTICKSITEQSTLADIIETLGNPYSVDYWSVHSKESGTYCYSKLILRYTVSAGTYNDQLEITLYADDNYITKVNLVHALP